MPYEPYKACTKNVLGRSAGKVFTSEVFLSEPMRDIVNPIPRVAEVRLPLSNTKAFSNTEAYPWIYL